LCGFSFFITLQKTATLKLFWGKLISNKLFVTFFIGFEITVKFTVFNTNTYIKFSLQLFWVLLPLFAKNG
jgi:hypothetical protein